MYRNDTILNGSWKPAISRIAIFTLRENIFFVSVLICAFSSLFWGLFSSLPAHFYFVPTHFSEADENLTTDRDRSIERRVAKVNAVPSEPVRLKACHPLVQFYCNPGNVSFGISPRTSFLVSCGAKLKTRIDDSRRDFGTNENEKVLSIPRWKLKKIFSTVTSKRFERKLDETCRVFANKSEGKYRGKLVPRVYP